MRASSRVLSGLTAAGLIAGITGPGYAALQFALDVSGTTFECVDGGACDTNPAVGVIQLAPFTLNGVFINGETITASGTLTTPGSLAFLNVSNLAVVNKTGVSKTVNAVVSDADFVGPVNSWASAGSGTWQSAKGSHITLNWWDDPANALGANSVTDTPGVLIDTFSNMATSVVQGFGTSRSGAASDGGLFSMTEQADYTLTAHGELLNRGETEVKTPIPEPSTWAMMLLGLAALGYVGFRRNGKTAVSFA